MSRTLVRPARHVSLARALHRRLYANCEGRVFVVSGRVAYGALKQALSCHDRVPTAAEAPNPADLGIGYCDGELSPPLLHSIRHALCRWRKTLSAETQRRPARRRAAITLARERQEIDRLESRLEALRQWQRQLAAGAEPAGAPLFLDPIAEASLQAAMDAAEREYPLMPLTAWQARLAYWLSGECAAKRFLAAATQLFAAYSEAAWRRPIRAFQQAVLECKRRRLRERGQHLRREISRHIRRLPPEAVRQGRFSARLRNRTFAEHCDDLLQGCEKLLAETEHRRWHVVPAAIAALAAADGGTAALPVRCFRGAVEKEDHGRFQRTVDALAQQIGQPGYDALLVALEQLREPPCDFELAPLCRLLGQGNTPAESVWAFQQGLLHSLAGSCLNVRAARRLGQGFAERGCPLNREELSLLVERLRRKEELQPVHAWLSWLSSISPRTITPRLRKTLLSAFWDPYLASAHRPGWFEQLAPCLTPARRMRDAMDCQPLLERIPQLQQLAGKTPALPKSLRKLLDARERRQQELETLRALQAAGAVDPAAQARLQHLENDAGALPRAAKIRRAVEGAFLLLGIESLTAVARRLAEAACRTHLGHLFTQMSPAEYRKLACWIDAMSEADRQCLQELIAAGERYGRDYKRHLAANQAWMDQARARGIDLDCWLGGECYASGIAGRMTHIEAAGELHHIFRMGAYFNTCLSFGGCNEMSVLANAYDANKQVVFMFAQDGGGRRCVIARQLIAISSDFKLLGYCCYVRENCPEAAAWEEVIKAMAAYCGRLAARCGLELADQGTPQAIGDHFWYDDGECEWTPEARMAWAGNRQRSPAAVASVC